MKKNCFILATIAALMSFSCSKIENVTEATIPETSIQSRVQTKGVDEKTPETFVYVETNDVNPLNAIDYWLADNTTFFDYVCFFSANIHKITVDSSEQPTLYLNPELCPYLCDNGTPVTTYTDAIHDNGQEAILSILGDWQGIGLSTMDATQQEQFAYILCCVITQCGFDGVLFDDEYSGSNAVVSGSYSGIITKFKALCPDKKVFVFDWGGTNNISLSAAGLIDGVHHGYFGYYLPNSYCNIPGIGTSQWSPISLELGQTYGSNALTTIQTWASNAKNSGYGEIMFFNLRTRSEVDPLPVLNKIASGAGWATPVTCTGGNRAQLTPVTGGCTITYEMAQNCCN